ncbi:hypothetical protein CO168_03025 [Candidatus Shapirobacteria bacterium CG_4_9_14_3_um_filter_36_12]|uniref:Uncharacterized protein n=3 Tax=Candidatus Shapironibacteriota TaxID=1752721 RepID=A0A2M7XMP8_9BACT|nr:MAG: hypothetical protein COS53_02270 [Candidatus Shapirobacteria bacterium CG03_land_8_20_14_0_80_35_14]PIX68221.1 MAG: hypothetical protein COZ41_00810 [Candidatus Shapirobacteria bacterium CG_4_10_14_3_um_filter_35_13]PJA50831.1 MAG: hypothetical protein CO168_03025 [Candidatus Shapirobacteria bacterium CG_4_9_14_3_um_filter_36_12]
MQIKIKLKQIFPSNPPRKISWDRVSNIENTEEYFEIINTKEKYNLPKYLPREGNHRLAKLYEKFGPNYQIKVKILEINLDNDLKNYQEGWIRCQSEGINNYRDFVDAAKTGCWERTP